MNQKAIKPAVPGDPPHTAPLPATLRPMELLDELDATVFREFHLEKGPGTCTPDEWEIRSINPVTREVIGSQWIDITDLKPGTYIFRVSLPLPPATSGLRSGCSSDRDQSPAPGG